MNRQLSVKMHDCNRCLWRSGKRNFDFKIMEVPLDYSAYSLDELYDVQRHIDKEKYAVTYAALLREIEKREAAQSEQPEYTPSTLESPIVVIPLACLGLYWSGWALFMIYAHLMPPAPGTRNDLEPWFGVLLGCIWVFVALMCFVPAIAYFKRHKK